MLFICIPAHNEAQTVGVLLWRIRTVFREYAREYELVVYDDGSTDATAEVLEPYTKVLPLTILRGGERRGYAAAVDALCRHVSKRTTYPRRDAMVLMQGDFTDAPEHLPELVKRFEGGADVVVAERGDGGGAEPTQVRRLRKIAPWVLRPFVRIDGVTDLTSPYRLIRISVVRDLLRERGSAPIVSAGGWAANVELLLAVAPYARRIEGVALPSRYDVRPRETRVRAGADALALARFAWRARGRRVTADRRPQPSAAEPAVVATGPTAVDAEPRARAEPATPRRERVPRAPRTGDDAASRAPERPGERPAEGSDRGGRASRPPRARSEDGSPRADRAERTPKADRPARPPRPPRDEPRTDAPDAEAAEAERPTRRERAAARRRDVETAAPTAPSTDPERDTDTSSLPVAPADGAPRAAELEAEAQTASGVDRGVASDGEAGAGEEPRTRSRRRRRRKKRGTGTAGSAVEAGESLGADGVDADEADGAGGPADAAAPVAERPRSPRPRRTGADESAGYADAAASPYADEAPVSDPRGAAGDATDDAAGDAAGDGSSDGTDTSARRRARRRRRGRRRSGAESTEGGEAGTGDAGAREAGTGIEGSVGERASSEPSHTPTEPTGDTERGAA